MSPTYYHNTDAELQPGDEIIPANERGHESPWKGKPAYSPGHVYLHSGHPDPYAYEGHGLNSYEVEPIGDVEEDPEKNLPGYVDVDQLAEHSYRAPRARVIRRVSTLDAIAELVTEAPESAQANPPVHRGLSIRLSGRAYDAIHDPAASPADIAQKILNQTSRRALGMHWSTDPDQAREFASKSPRTGSSDLPIVLHAEHPAPEDIETRPFMLNRREVHGPEHWEQEVPVRKGRNVRVTGVSWRPHEPHPAADADGWVHYSLDGSMPHTAEQTTEAAGELMIDLYHRTTPEAAEAIGRDKKMHSKENSGEAFFSTFKGDEPDAQGSGYGTSVVHVRVPEHLAELDDEFPTGEQHYRVDTRTLRPEHFVTASGGPNDPASWNWRQQQWKTQPPQIEQTRPAGDFLMHAEPPDENGDRQIHVTNPAGEYVGEMYFGDSPEAPGHLEGAPSVRPDHRRRGIGTAMYDWAEELGGKPMAPSSTHSDDAEAFWRSRRQGVKVSGQDDAQGYLDQRYPQVDHDVTERPDAITLHKLVVPKQQRGQGIGSAYMNDLINYADSKGKRVELTPDTSFGGSSKSRLQRFYKGFGFVPNKDQSISNTMVRPAQPFPADVTSVKVASSAYRMMQPAEYRKLKFPDFPGHTLDYVAKRLKRDVPDYYAALHQDIAQNGVKSPILLDGNYVRDGHHRLAVAHELGLPVPVGDYNNEADYGTAFNPLSDEWFQKRQDLGADRLHARPKGWRGAARAVPADLQPGQPQLDVKDYDGEVGNETHITRNERGWIPTSAVAQMVGVKGEIPGEHRNMHGAAWDEFKNDLAANGIREPLFITVDHNQDPQISEGNHRRDAAVELGHSHVPVEIRYFGHAEQQGSVHERSHPAVDSTVAVKTAASTLPEDMQIEYTPGGIEDYGGSRSIAPHYLRAHIPHPEYPDVPTLRKDIGWLYLDGRPDEDGGHRVSSIEVRSDYRRRGVGTALWNHAHSLGLKPRHEDMGVMTPEGHAWSSAVGDAPSTATATVTVAEALKYASAAMDASEPDFIFHVQASWKDVREKAKAIRADGGVRIVAHRNGEIVGHVKGASQVYESTIVFVPGSNTTGSWTCGCAWSAYSWGRTGRWRKFEGRRCSHVLALQYEAQARRWLGKDIKLDVDTPHWLGGADEIKVPGEWDRDQGGYLQTAPEQPKAAVKVAEAEGYDKVYHLTDNPDLFERTSVLNAIADVVTVREAAVDMDPGRQYRGFDEFELHNHGLDSIVLGARVTFGRSKSDDINHKLTIDMPDPNIPAHPKFPTQYIPVGNMSWHPRTGRVEGIHTEPDFQHKGIATGMWNLGHQLADEQGLTAPKHSETQTDEGRGWAGTTSAVTINEVPDFAHDTYQGEIQLRRHAVYPRNIDQAGAEAKLQEVLKAHNIPQADQAFVEVSHGGSPKSSTAWDLSTVPAIPGVRLAPGMHDHLTLLHEAAHIIDNHKVYGPAAMLARPKEHSTSDVHDGTWLETYRGLVHDHLHPQAGRKFDEIFPPNLRATVRTPLAPSKVRTIDSIAAASFTPTSEQQGTQVAKTATTATSLLHRGPDTPGAIHTPGKTAAKDPVYYHGTRWPLNPGDVLEGGKSRANQGYGEPAEHVYYSERPDFAAGFAESGYGPDEDYDAKPRIYRVKPLDDPEADPDESAEGKSWRSRRVQVLDELPSEHVNALINKFYSAEGSKNAERQIPTSEITSLPQAVQYATHVGDVLGSIADRLTSDVEVIQSAHVDGVVPILLSARERVEDARVDLQAIGEALAEREAVRDAVGATDGPVGDEPWLTGIPI